MSFIVLMPPNIDFSCYNFSQECRLYFGAAKHNLFVFFFQIYLFQGIHIFLVKVRVQEREVLGLMYRRRIYLE
jgi:hypothetical protein